MKEGDTGKSLRYDVFKDVRMGNRAECPGIDTKIYHLTCKDIVILYTFDTASSHGLLDVLQESIPILAHFRGCFCKRHEGPPKQDSKVIYLYSVDHPRLALRIDTAIQP